MKKLIKRYNKPGEWEVIIQFDNLGEECEWLGIVDAREPGEYSLKVIAEHSVAKTRGKVTVRAVCGEDSVIKIKGVIRIARGAQETDNFLELRVLTLGPRSRAVAEPELEIEANNVRASHAASVGRIDPEQLLYLQSRGVDVDAAIKHMVSGFLLE